MRTPGWLLPCAALTLLCAPLFFWRLADRDLWSSHEGRAAMNARSVLRDGPARLPQVEDGRPETQKPPLYYWLVAAVAWARGGEVDALAVRLPAALAGLGCVLLLALLPGRERAGVGPLAGAVLATAIHVTWLARIGRIDLPLAFTTLCAAAAVYRSRASGRPDAWLAAAYLAAAAGVLLKGPIGFALPAAVLAAHLLLEGAWPACWELAAWRRLAGEYRLAPGLLLVAAVVVPVFAWAEWASGGAFLRDFLWHHNWQRGLGGSRLRAHPWWQYGPFFALYFLPWTPVLLVALLDRAWRRDPLARFGLAWALGVTVLLSCARFKRADYLLPAYPGAALFVGCALARWRARLPRAVPAGFAVVVLGVLAGWGVRVLHTLPAEERWRDYTRFGRLVRAAAPPPAPVVFFRAEAHALAFHVGRPQRTLVAWDDLAAALAGPGPHAVVLPAGLVEELRDRNSGLAVEERGRTTDPVGRHERPLALVTVSSGAGGWQSAGRAVR